MTISDEVLGKERGGKVAKIPEENESSKLFVPFRVVGRVVDRVPAAVHYMGGVPFITASVESLNITFVSQELASPIKALRDRGEHTLVATSDGLYMFDRARLCSSIPLKTGNLVCFDIIGEVLLWLRPDGLDMYSFPTLDRSGSFSLKSCGSAATCMVHPSTYLNKILFGFDDGHMELWNIRTNKKVYSFSSLESPITCMTPSRVLDIVAVGLESGKVWLYDLRLDKKLFCLNHKASIASISFRTDTATESHVAVALSDGSIIIWILETKRVHSIWSAHEGSVVSSMAFIQGQPILITTGTDNAIKEWIIEGTEVRLLKSRSGHSKTPRKIRFYGDSGESILSAGRDRAFRSVSMIKDSQSTELSQGSIESICKRAQLKPEDIKLDPIISFDAFITKDLKWDNVVTAHEKSSVARTWRADHKKMGTHTLRTVDGSFVSSVAMSCCGNFALIGSEMGNIDVFNIQSGLHRKHITGHNSPIIGLGVDPAIQYLVCVHKNGHVRCLDFKSGQAQYTIILDGQVKCAVAQPDSELFAIALDSSKEAHVLDISTGVVVRKFIGHEDTIVDLFLTQDSRWLITAGMDKTVRTWDMATGLQIDILRLSGCPVSIAMSPIMDFLAVVLEDDVSIHVWSNMSMYRPVALEGVKNITFVPSLGDCNIVADLAKDLVELSLESRSKFTNLFHLDTIKTRNKPILPPKAAEKTPFFLDALSGKHNKRDALGEAVVQEDQIELESSELVSMLSDSNIDSEKVMNYLKSLGPATVDLEIRSITAHSIDELGPLMKLLDIIVGHLANKADYEVTITYLNTIIKSHSDTLSKFPTEFKEILAQARLVIRSIWSNVEDEFHKAICLNVFSRDQQI